MPTALLDNPVEASHHVFDLLKSRGPLCASQISVEMGLPLRRVRSALEALQAEGLVELRPDPDTSIQYDELEIPWGVALRRRAR